MLKHATISRTSRAQQTLQLQRHWQHQDQQLQLGCNHKLDGATGELEGKTIPNEPQQQAEGVQQVNLFESNNHQQDPIIRADLTSSNLMDDPLQTTDQSELTPLPSLPSSQRFLQPNGSPSCLSPVPTSVQHPMQSLNYTPMDNSSYTLPAKCRSTPSSLTNSPMKPLIITSRHRSSTRSSRFPPMAGQTTQSSTLTRTCSNSLTSPSLSLAQQQDSMIKIFAQTLSQDVEYITLHVNTQTKSQQIIKTLLRKFRLKHRDPNLFHLTLERWIRKDGLKFKSVMLLGDEACPLQLQQCCSNPPHNDIKFTLQMRSGALVKIYCSDVVPDAKYKCLSLSTQTTVEETIELMLYCLNLASQTTTKSTSTTTTIDTHHHHHQRQFSDSPNSSSVSSSSSETSSSSGIESEPNNNNIVSNTNNNNNISSSSRQTSTTKTRHAGQLDSDSRASSVTSISSSSNVSSLSSSLIEQYCMVIECKDSNFKRVLHPDEYLVDVYQGLLAEAGKTYPPPAAPAALGSDSDSGASSLTNQNNGSNSGSSISSPAGQSPDQWFFIKLKKRYDFIAENNNHNSIAAINYVSPRQNDPLPPIPPSLFKHHQQASNNNLRNVVSTTQIEVSRPGSSLAITTTTSANSTESELMREIMRSTPVMLADYAMPQHLATSSAAAARDELDSSISSVHEGEVPPPIILLTPPVRPRRRNLSNASSTFGRPLTVSNRRRYDPAQLADDLDKLNVAAGNSVAPVVIE